MEHVNYTNFLWPWQATENLPVMIGIDEFQSAAFLTLILSQQHLQFTTTCRRLHCRLMQVIDRLCAVFCVIFSVLLVDTVVCRRRCVVKIQTERRGWSVNARREIERKRRSDVRGRYRHRGVMIAQVTDHGHMVTTAANVVAAAAVRGCYCQHFTTQLFA